MRIIRHFPAAPVTFWSGIIIVHSGQDNPPPRKLLENLLLFVVKIKHSPTWHSSWYGIFQAGHFQVGRKEDNMNVSIINKPNVKSSVLDELARELPVIIADVMQVPGGNMALLKPDQVSLEFSQASLRDIGSDLRIMVFARSNDPRTSTENDRAKAILEKVVALIATSGEECSVDIRLYLMEVGAAEHALG